MHLWLDTQEYGKILAFFTIRNPDSQNLDCRFRVKDDNPLSHFAGRMSRINGQWIPEEELLSGKTSNDKKVFDYLIRIIVQYFIDNPNFENQVMINELQKSLTPLRAEEFELQQKIHSLRWKQTRTQQKIDDLKIKILEQDLPEEEKTSTL